MTTTRPMTAATAGSEPMPLDAPRSTEPRDSAGAAHDESGVRDFDFLVGDWRVRHRRLKERLAGCAEWVEFDGTCSMRPLMEGGANVDDNVLEPPGGAYRAVGLRAFDPQTRQWAIWWLDGRTPNASLEPPVRGRFEGGIGTFVADDTLDGKPIRVRFVWSAITPQSARWEQAFSPDGGLSWETNWQMEFRRA